MPERIVGTDFTARRFNCCCGAVLADGGHAMEHFAKHKDVGIEEYRNGLWHLSPVKNIETLIWYRLRERGESPDEFLRRIQEKVAMYERDEEN